MNFEIVVSGKIESDNASIARETLQAAAVEAVTNELRNGESVGFSHRLEDDAAITISSVQSIAPPPSECVIDLGMGQSVFVRTTEGGGACISTSGLKQQGRGNHNAAIDGMESMLLALVGEGFDPSTPKAKRAIEDALYAIRRFCK